MGSPPEPAVSVIIPCFNAALTLPLQLMALTEQRGDVPPFEVIVVDNRSSDDLKAVIDEWSRKTPFNLRMVAAPYHQGSSYARNVGIEKSHAELLMFCDADDVVSGWWIEQGVKSFEVGPLWSGAAILIPADEPFSSVESIREAFSDSAEWRRPLPEQDTAFPILMGGNFGASRSVMRTIGGFDQSFAFQGDDNDLGFRAHLAGVPVLNATTVRVGYRGKWATTSILRGTFRSAQAHALIASRYRAWPESPFPTWWSEPLRCLVAGIRMILHPPSRDWAGLSTRTASALGILTGRLRYSLTKTRPSSQLGVGWLDQERTTGEEG